MAIYSTRPTADQWFDDGPLIPEISVPDHKSTFTGLLDSNGDKIYKEPRSMGFHARMD